MTTKQRAYRVYRGVKIYREKEMIPGSDFDINDNGEVIPRKPKYDIWYTIADGKSFKSETVEEIKSDIDNMFKECEKRSVSEKMVIDIMNET